VTWEFGDEVWAKVRPLIPPIEQRPRAHRGRRALSDRAMLSALVFLARRRRGFWSLRREQGYGSGLTVKRRLEYWLEVGVWDPVCEVLAESLPDGRDVDWRWWEAYSQIVLTS
jgi:transposase